MTSIVPTSYNKVPSVQDNLLRIESTQKLQQHYRGGLHYQRVNNIVLDGRRFRNAQIYWYLAHAGFHLEQEVRTRSTVAAETTPHNNSVLSCCWLVCADEKRTFFLSQKIPLSHLKRSFDEQSLSSVFAPTAY
jgi:cellobiose phosphorylase